MKKFLCMVLACLMAVGAVSLAACSKPSEGVKQIDIKLTSEEYAFAVNPNDTELLEKVNAFLTKIKGNGQFAEVCNRYFSDGTPVAVESAVEDKSKDQLVVVTEPGFEPFEYTSGNKFLGVDMELAKMLADELGKELVIKIVEFDSIFDMLNTGDADIGMAGITVKPDREKLVKFSNTYYEASQKLIVKKSDTRFDACKTAEDVEKVLAGLAKDTKIGVQTGTTGQDYLTGANGFAGFKNLKDVGFTTGSLAISAMINGDVSLVIIDEAPGTCMVEAYNKMN